MIKKIIILFIIAYAIPCYSSNLGSLDPHNILDQIITSIKEEPEKWLIRGNGLYYFNDDGPREEARNSLYPELKNGCLVHISMDIIGHDDGYLIINTIVKEFNVRDLEERKELTLVIRQFLYNHLHNHHGLRISKKEEVKEVPKPVEPEPESNLNDIYGTFEDKW